jgi:3-hydroxypropanoate dehydrogenase
MNALHTLTPTAPSRLALDEVSQDLLFRAARTVNTYADEPVTDEQVQAIYDLVKYAPTAANSQPLRIFLVRSDEAREHLLKHVSEGNREKAATAPLVAILAADTDFHEHLPRVFPHLPGMKDSMTDGDAREKMARFNSALQVAYFLLGVRAAGLAAGPMGGFDAAGLDEDFFPDGRHKSLLVVGIGRPGANAWHERLPRLDYDEVVTTL